MFSTAQKNNLMQAMLGCVASFLLPACASQQKNQWENIDYSPVYKAYGDQGNDAGYTPPSVLGCVDDDLYNCR
jgi:hypothetical protein